MGNDLISIIVPVYNVEKYIKQCVDSIISQSYENIEIILVDDGSSDSSGAICDNYASLDKRIKVIHKENGGLSDARNAGVAQATGEYIGFVDSDDYIEANMYELLIKMCRENNTKIACARWQYEPKSINEIEHIPIPTHERRILSDDELIYSILTGSEDNFSTISVWDRLYHRSVISNMVFPKGKCYEDLVYSIQAIINSGLCGYIDEPLYHYRIREGSITHNSISSPVSERIYTDAIPLMLEQINLLNRVGKRELACIDSMVVYTALLRFKGLADDEFKRKITDEALRNTKISIFDVLNTKLKFKRKMANILRLSFPDVFVWYYCVCRK